MNRIGFAIGEESETEEPQVGHVDSSPADEEETAGYGYWLFRTCTDFLMVYGLIVGSKNVINFIRRE